LDFPLYEEGLKVPEGKSLLFVGGDVSVNRARLSAPGGRIELGGLAGSGTVGLNVNGNDLRLSFINGVAQADIHLLKGTFIDTITTSNTEGGGIVISAHNITF
jgi:large exoprotein involved in heme utilization and adhesion